MIVFYVLKENEKLRKLYNDLKSKDKIPVFWLNQEQLIIESQIQLKNSDDFIIGSIKTPEEEDSLSIEQVKIWLLAQYPCVLQEWLPYEDPLDTSYAQQEWNATISAMLLTQNSARFINPLWAKFDFNTEIEQLLIMQRFNFKTLDMILTNNVESTLQYYDLWKRQVLYKSVRKGYDTASIMKPSDLGRLDKLHLSPAIFQKSQMGDDITVCMVGKNFCAVKYDNNDTDQPYKQVELPDTLKNRLIKLSEYLNAPWIVTHFLYDEEQLQYYAYGINVFPDFEFSYMIFGESFVEMLRNYLVEEYNK